jgi:hypothetical protein
VTVLHNAPSLSKEIVLSQNVELRLLPTYKSEFAPSNGGFRSSGMHRPTGSSKLSSYYRMLSHVRSNAGLTPFSVPGAMRV